MQFRIREATKEDAIVIADISRQTFYETFAGENRPEDMEKFMNEQFTRGRLMLEVGQKPNTFLLAVHGDEIAGYVKLRDAEVPKSLGKTEALEIARIYAVQKMIGKGVGRLLMEESLARARAMNKKVAWLGVWKQNVRAIRFYEQFGFTCFDEVDFVLGNDIQKDWLMKKML
jgi:diamine N-acetyltransferase